MKWLIASYEDDLEKEIDKADNRDSKTITTYDPEYKFLLALIKVVVHQGVSADEVTQILHAYPFQTVGDIGDIAAKLWTLATGPKYRIPSDWLEKQLPESRFKNKGELMSTWLTRAAGRKMGWLKKADDMAMAAPSGAPPMPKSNPIMPTVPPGGPKTEKEDVATAESVIKALKALISREKSEEEPGEVKMLEDALKKMEQFAEAEKEEAEEQAELKKKEDEKAKKEQEKLDKELAKEEEKTKKEMEKMEKKEKPVEKKEEMKEDGRY